MILVHEVGGSSPPPRAFAVLSLGGSAASLLRKDRSHGSFHRERPVMVPSSRGLGHHPLKVETRVRTPLGLLGQRCLLTFQRTIAKNPANSSGDGARPVPVRSTDEIPPD